MEGYEKVAVVRVPAPGRQVTYSGVAFALPPDGTPYADLRAFWRKPLKDMGRTTHAAQDEAVRAILELASAHVGVEREPGKMERVRLETRYFSERTGKQVTLSADPKTGELRVAGETPEEPEEPLGEPLGEPEEPEEPLGEAGAAEASEEAEELREAEEAREAAQQEAAEAEDEERDQTPDPDQDPEKG